MQRVVRRYSVLRREVAEHRALLGVLAAHNLETLRRESVPQRNALHKPFFSILLAINSPSAVFQPPLDRIVTFVVGNNGHLYDKYYNGQQWAWEVQGDPGGFL